MLITSYDTRVTSCCYWRTVYCRVFVAVRRLTSSVFGGHRGGTRIKSTTGRQCNRDRQSPMRAAESEWLTLTALAVFLVQCRGTFCLRALPLILTVTATSIQCSPHTPRRRGGGLPCQWAPHSNTTRNHSFRQANTEDQMFRWNIPEGVRLRGLRCSLEENHILGHWEYLALSRSIWMEWKLTSPCSRQVQRALTSATLPCRRILDPDERRKTDLGILWCKAELPLTTRSRA